ncbi:hypothetical protein ACHAWF_007615 [Thalassiosira exigua]
MDDLSTIRGVNDPDTRSGNIDGTSPPSDSHPFDALVASTNFSDLIPEPDDINEKEWRENNIEILEGLKGNHSDFDETWFGPWFGAEDNKILPEKGLTLVWWGYLIGRNTNLNTLGIYGDIAERFQDLTEDQVELFFKGLCRNKSIENLFLGSDWDDYEYLRPFFANNPNLKFLQMASSVHLASLIAEAKTLENIEIIGDETHNEITGELVRAVGSHPCLKFLYLKCNGHNREGNAYMDMESLAAILQHPTSSLSHLKLSGGFDDEGLETLTAALFNNRMLDLLQLSWNHVMTRRGWGALSELLRSGKCSLRCLRLYGHDLNDESFDTGLDDEGIEILVHGLHHNVKLQEIALNGRSITTRGWQTFLSLLQNHNFNLEELHLKSVNFDDQMALLFARALSTNNTLRKLNFFFSVHWNHDSRAFRDLSVAGWEDMSQLLCDTSSINKTFLSNHVLQSLGTMHHITPERVCYLLNLNRNPDKKHVAIRKILLSHPDFDLSPLCKWGLKMLPLFADWFDRAAGYDEELDLERRKFSEIFKFVRGASGAGNNTITGDITAESATVPQGHHLRVGLHRGTSGCLQSEDLVGVAQGRKRARH